MSCFRCLGGFNCGHRCLLSFGVLIAILLTFQRTSWKKRNRQVMEGPQSRTDGKNEFLPTNEKPWSFGYSI